MENDTDNTAGSDCPSPTFDDLVAARKEAYEKLDYPAGSEETEKNLTWMQWRRTRTTEDLDGYIWCLLEKFTHVDCEMGQALFEIMSRLRNKKRRVPKMDAMVKEILKQAAAAR